MIKAAMDIGTNSVRLLVAKIEGGRLSPIHKALNTTRLGEGVHHSGVLAPPAMERTIAAVAQFVETGKKLGAEALTAVATSAVRDAANGAEFVQLCRMQTGVDVGVLDGETEAQLSFAGATAGSVREEACLVVDIGGGSTEFAYGQSSKLYSARSVNLGAVRLSELFPAQGDGVVDNLTAIQDYIDKVLTTVDFPARPFKLIGVGGTITSLAAVDQRLLIYDSSKVHGYYLSKAALSEILTKLAATTLAERRRVPGLQPERADIIVYGTAILEKVLHKLSAGGIYVSEQDILEGLILCQK